MKTVMEAARQTGVSVRTLHHYHAIGLLEPTRITGAGYRLYDDRAMARLHRILLLRELGLSLKEIRVFLDAPEEEQHRILQQQIQLLEEKRARLDRQITLARGIGRTGAEHLMLEDVNMAKLDDYTVQAKALYGKTEAYREYEQKAAGRTGECSDALGRQLMALFARLGQLRELSPDAPEIQGWVKALQSFITEHYYTCTPQILKALGQMYAEGGSMTENIDAAGGRGTAELAKRAIDSYCES